MDGKRKRKQGSLTSDVLHGFSLPLVAIAVSALDCFQTRRLLQSYSDSSLAASQLQMDITEPETGEAVSLRGTETTKAEEDAVGKW